MQMNTHGYIRHRCVCVHLLQSSVKSPSEHQREQYSGWLYYTHPLIYHFLLAGEGSSSVVGLACE